MKIQIILSCILITLLSCNNSKRNKEQVIKGVETHNNADNKLVIDKEQREVNIIAETTIVKNQQQFIQNKDTEIGVINDPDGFTNLRSEPNTVSTILTKIKLNEYFFFNTTQYSDWFKVKNLYGFVGYIHKSRVELVVNDKLFNVSFVDYLEKEEKKKDSIILLKDLDVFFETHYAESIFNYDKIELTKANDSSATYSIDDIEVKISRMEFEANKHKLEYYKEYEDYVEKIDGKEFWGADGGVPRFEISEIKITQDGDSFFIPKMEIKNIFEPNLKYVTVYKTKDKRIIISMMNSDGAGAYSAIFIVKNKRVLKRIVFVSF